jgi:hypothetical protein
MPMFEACAVSSGRSEEKMATFAAAPVSASAPF